MDGDGGEVGQVGETCLELDDDAVLHSALFVLIAQVVAAELVLGLEVVGRTPCDNKIMSPGVQIHHARSHIKAHAA